MVAQLIRLIRDATIVHADVRDTFTLLPTPFPVYLQRALMMSIQIFHSKEKKEEIYDSTSKLFSNYSLLTRRNANVLFFLSLSLS